MVKKKIRHILGISGGKDSTALAILLHKRIPNLEFFFCDTHKELPETYEYLNRIETRLGIKIERLGADAGFDKWLDLHNGYLPSAQARWCTRKLKLEQVVLDDVLEEVIFLIKSSKDFKKEVIIVKGNAKENISVVCDPQQITQVLFNLLINAVDAVDERGKINVSHEKSSSGDQVRITVSDNGKGMSQEILDSIFEPFSSSRDNGVGLGLAIVLSIIKEHQGDIKVESRLGKGTSFHVFLPLK